MVHPNEPSRTQEQSDSTSLTWSHRWLKVAVVLVILGGLAAVYWANRDWLSLQALAQRQESIVSYQRSHPFLVLAAAYLLYTTITGLSLPGAAVMTLLYGWFFRLTYGSTWGLAVGLIVVSFASTTGATLAFLLSRFVLGEPIQRRFGAQLERFNQALRREGAFYLFTLRLIPAVPFFVINLVMGLTPIKARTFWWVSQAGMLPGTFVYVLAGSRLPGPKEILERGASGILTWDLILAFAVLGLFPFVVKRLMSRMGRGTMNDE